jgi:molybdate transport system regulatory protein
MYKLKYKIWLEKEGKVFGKGPYELLNGIKNEGSLAGATKSMKMSYNKAFNLIKDIETNLGYKLLVSKRGGADKGSSNLTIEAEELMSKYESFVHECDLALNQIFEKYFK